ncbi:hypothetical protein KKE45_03405, partial [Patescibacteria group bacterium]|nr:hypothetical protein [Patescibacteria group bacterium]
MDLNRLNIASNFNKIAFGNTIDLGNVASLDPWSMITMCLLLAKRANKDDKKFILPKDLNALCFLKEMCFDNFLKEIGFDKEAKKLSKIEIPKLSDEKVLQIEHYEYQSEFEAKLAYFIEMFKNFGLNQSDAYRATSLIGELGNNVFDHNLGNWPTNIRGCFITGQNYSKEKKIEITVGDPGIGFWGSLKNAFPELNNDVEAIIKGLGGNTGRMGEKRGNGLKLIQDWTINK